MIVDAVLRLLAAYLLGSLNGSLLLGRLRGVDIRQQGSGNAGGTNALRTQGPLFALGVVFIDVIKGYVAVRWLGQNAAFSWLPEACASAAVVGHVYPVFHGFRGGKGAATLVGVLAALSPALLWQVMAVWLVCVVLAGYVGLATMLAALAAPILAWLQGADARSALFMAALALFVVFTHRGNIARMRAGNEPRANRLWLLGRWLQR
jgi:glycerol-3-phosphate acyltransferase PlsY